MIALYMSWVYFIPEKFDAITITFSTSFGYHQDSYADFFPNQNTPPFPYSSRLYRL